MRDGAISSHTVAAPEQSRRLALKQDVDPVLNEFATLDPTGNANKSVIVNADGTGFLFGTPSSGGTLFGLDCGTATNSGTPDYAIDGGSA